VYNYLGMCAGLGGVSGRTAFDNPVSIRVSPNLGTIWYGTRFLCPYILRYSTPILRV
jgi:hypothetical protein